MPLVQVEVPEPREEELPARARELIREADQRIRSFLDGRDLPAFVCSDAVSVGRALQAVVEANLAPGDAVCEWGSGFGVVTLVAACLGYRAWGIEIDADLVDAATRLAADFELEAEFVCGTFVPPGGEDLTDVHQEFGWLAPGGACGYEALGVDPSEFDLVFAYPWPGEEEAIDDLFERFAGSSALLLTYHGIDGLRLRRKVATELS